VRVLAACSLGGSGHLQPLLPFLAAAERRRHEVLVTGPPALEDMVRRAGYPFRAGGEPAESEVGPIRELLPLAPPEEASRLGNRELFGRLATDAMLPAMEAVCRDWRPDLLLREPCEYSSAVVGPRVGIPVAQVAISTAAVEQGSITMAGPVLEMHRPGLVGELRAAPYLTRFPASLDPSDFGSTVRYRNGPASPRRLPDWWGGRSGPLIYMTFGTVLPYMSIAAEVYRAVLAAVAAVPGSRVLLTVGTHFDPALIGPTPDQVHVEAWVDQSDVLCVADLVLCHGGSGTVLGALGAGVPVVAVPVFADQSENAKLVVGAGAGEVVRCGPGGTGGTGRSAPGLVEGDVARNTRAAEAVLLDPAYRAGATRVAAEMAGAPTAPEVLEELLHRS
jgi:UDP:flavonoid glycosyltransferase YjiC (YdhE family)